MDFYFLKGKSSASRLGIQAFMAEKRKGGIRIQLKQVPEILQDISW